MQTEITLPVGGLVGGLLPEIFLSFIIVALLVYGVICEAFKIGGTIGLQKKFTWLSIIGLGLTFVIALRVRAYGLRAHIATEAHSDPLCVASLGGINDFTMTVKLIVLGCAILILVLSMDFFAKETRADSASRSTNTLGVTRPEYTLLILLATLGMILLVSSKDLIPLYLSIELLSLSLYVLAAMRRPTRSAIAAERPAGALRGDATQEQSVPVGAHSTEAGLRYFLLGALSSGVLLFGCGLIYVITGQTGFTEIANYTLMCQHQALTDSAVWGLTGPEHVAPAGAVAAGALFIVIAILFKLAAAPFHMWAPDVYDGSPTIVTAFFAIVPKIAIFSVLAALVFGPFYGLFSNTLQPLLTISAIMSVITGSVGALNQTRIKRLLAYSAIGHMGFILLGLALGTFSSLHASIVYFVLYIIMTLNSFAFVMSVTRDVDRRTDFISQLSGLSRSQPVLAITFALCLLSLAGIPPLAGFFSKFLVLFQAVANGWYVVALTAVLFSVVGCFYYIRIIQVMYFKDQPKGDYHYKDLGTIALSPSAAAAPLRRRAAPPQGGPAGAERSQSVIWAGVSDAPKSIVLGVTLFFIITALIYPNPILMFTFDSLINALV